MAENVTGQVTHGAAEFYEAFFVPALFQPWTAEVADAAALAPGQRVLDVACGTGALAREAAKRVEPGGSVAGLDRNEGMIAVARRAAPGIEWRLGPAEAMPFADQTFDAVVSQFGLMFFEDPVAALKEMRRVLKPGGRLAVAVWDALERVRGYAAMAALLQRLFGERIANELKVPFALGDPDTLRAMFGRAGVAKVEIRTREGTARFPSIESWVNMDVKGWTLGDLLDDAQHQTLLREAEREMRPFVEDDGTVAFPMPAHIVLATKA